LPIPSIIDQFLQVICEELHRKLGSWINLIDDYSGSVLLLRHTGREHSLIHLEAVETAAGSGIAVPLEHRWLQGDGAHARSMAVLVTTAAMRRELAARLVVAVTAAVEALDVGFLGRRARRRSLRVGREDSRGNRS
jgi:hypothetical protein